MSSTPTRRSAGRLVIDLRHVNAHHVAVTCELEDLRSLWQLLELGDWMVAIDLSNGYYHVGVAEDTAQYFQLKIRTSGGIECFEILALNMGAVFSPGAFTDFLRPLVRQLRREGHRLLWYMDDFLVMGCTPSSRRDKYKMKWNKARLPSKTKQNKKKQLNVRSARSAN